MLIRNTKGQSLVETAFVLPIVLLILLGIMDFGLMFNSYLTVSNAAREGARTAAVGATDAEITQLVEDVASTLNVSNISVTITPAESSRKKGDEVTVTVAYGYKLITPIISAIVHGPLELTSRSVMRIE